MNYLHAITINAMKENTRLRKHLTGRLGLGEIRNSSVPDNMEDNRYEKYILLKIGNKT